MKRRIFTVIGILSLFVLFSCTVDNKSTGTISIKLPEDFSSKIESLSSARAARDAEESTEAVEDTSIDEDLTLEEADAADNVTDGTSSPVKIVLSAASVTDECLYLNVANYYFNYENFNNLKEKSSDKKDENNDENTLILSNVELGLTVTVKMEVYVENELYYEGTSDAIIVEEESEATITLKSVKTDSDATDDTDTTVTDDDNKTDDTEAADTEDKTDDDKTSEEETTDTTDDSEKTEADKADTTETGDTTADETETTETDNKETTDDTAADEKTEETDTPDETTDDTGSTATAEITVDENACAESDYVIYDANRTDIRNILSEAGTQNKCAKLSDYCFDYKTGDVYGITSSNIYKYSKESGYDLAKCYSYNLTTNNNTIKDICFIDGVIYILYVNGIRTYLVPFYSDDENDILLSVKEDLKDNTFVSIYSSLSYDELATDGKNLYILTKGLSTSTGKYEDFITTYSVTTSITENTEPDKPTDQSKTINVTLEPYANNILVSYSADLGSYTILGKSSGKVSENAVISDFTIVGKNAFALINDSNYDLTNDKTLVSKGALVALGINDDGTMAPASDGCIYGLASGDYCTDLSSELLGPAKFNKLSPTSISFVDEGFMSSDEAAEVKCRVITIDLKMFNETGALKFYEKDTTASGSKYGYYVDTTAFDDKWTFSNLSLKRY